MYQILTFFYAILLFLLVGITLPTKAQPSQALEGLIDQIVEPYFKNEAVNGLSVGIIDEGYFYKYHYGHISKTDTLPPNNETLYHIGSITKVITATLLKSLEAEGILRADDPITKYLPDSLLEKNPILKEITLVQLVTHTSGLPKEPLNKISTITNWNNPYSNYQIEDVYRYLQMHEHPEYLLKARKKKRKLAFSYSHFGIGLLGHLIENATHENYETLLHQYICRPLEMREISVNLDTLQEERLALGHDFRGRELEQQYYASLYSSEGIKTSLEDMMLFVAANMDTSRSNILGGVLAQTHEGLAKTQMRFVEVGYAWYVDKRAKKSPFQIISISGKTSGYSAYAAFVKKYGIGVVILSNSANRCDPVGASILQLLLR